MKEKILALLLAKFAGVRKDGLAQLARTLDMQVTTEAEAQALIDKLSVEKVTDFVKEWRADVDKEVTTGVSSHETKLKTKFNFVEKTTEPPTPPIDPNKDKDKDLATQITAAVTAAVKPLQDKLASFETGKTLDSRKKTLTERLSDEKYKNIPEKTKAKIQKDFERMSFQKDEDFDAFLQDTETDLAAINQEVAELGLSQHGSPVFNRKEKDGVSSSVQAYIDANKEGAKGNIEGKQI